MIQDAPNAPAFEPELSRLGSIIQWLRSRDVPVSLLSDLFQVTSNHIRVLDHRGSGSGRIAHRRHALVNLVFAPLTAKVRKRLGLRPYIDREVLTDLQISKFDQIEEALEARTSRFANSFSLKGAESLRELTSLLGFPAKLESVRLLARIHQQMGWFATHNGFTTSALRELVRASLLWRIAHQETVDSYDLKGLHQALRFAAHACTLSGDSWQASRLLNYAREAAEKAGVCLGSDFYRLRGVVQFQQGIDCDRQALQNFTTAMHVMEKLGEAASSIEVDMVGARQSFLLESGSWDRAQELMYQAREFYGPSSLQASMIVHWTAACGLATDSPSVTTKALEILEANRSTARKFGHQATVSRLLSIAPHLGLQNKGRLAFVRMALYQNAFCNQ
jgi:hypothetical protein